MLPSTKFQLLIRRLTQNLTWPVMLLLVFIQAALTYLLLDLAEESELTKDPLRFIYYNMVVVSTVGFGDFSPITNSGKMIVAFFQIPSGLIIFASFIGKITQLFINISRKNMNGSNNFSHYKDHILLLSWDQNSTEQVVQLILGDKKRQQRQILLCVTDDIQNPFPDNINVSFARISSFSETKELERIAINKAERIILLMAKTMMKRSLLH